MIEGFSTQFSPLYLPMKYLAIISTHCIVHATYTIAHRIKAALNDAADKISVTVILSPDV